MKKKENTQNRNFIHAHSRELIAVVCILFAIPLLSVGVFEGYYADKVYPRVNVAGVEVSGMTKSQVESALRDLTASRLKEPLSLSLSTGQNIALGNVGDFADYDLNRTVDAAFAYGRKGSLTERAGEKFRGFTKATQINAVYSFDKQPFDTQIANAIRPFERPVIDSQLAYANGNAFLSSSQKGFVANRDNTISEFENFLAFRKNEPVLQAELRDQQPEITEENSKDALAKANLALTRPLTLKSSYLPGSTWALNKEQLFSLMTLKQINQKVELVFDDYKVASYAAPISQLVNREPVDAKFELDGERVKVFEPAEPGLLLDTVELTSVLSARAFDSSSSTDVEVPVKTTEPALSTSNVNNYGIKELVGQGKSKFVGSPSGRIHNLALASSKLNGVLIAPGETFSMYKIVGEVEKSTGYQDAFIIKDGRTVPGVGGGLCQVSTTLFRAALNAGLPIVERHQHAYRVYYYEQDSPPGIDAAVYFPSWDFKFKNDTGSTLLLQTKVDTKKMTAEFNLYGVKDGRVVDITKPVVTNQAPPPPELRMDDPTLARGQEKEVDHAVWGADTIFSQTVSRDGQQLFKNSFKSAYKPWQRVVMVGVKD